MKDINPAVAQLKNNKLLNVFATLVSWVFHPIWMPPVMALLLYFAMPWSMVNLSQKDFFHLFGIIVINTTFFSLIFIGLLRAIGFLSNVQMPNPKDRIVPLLGVMIFYFWCYHVLNNLEKVPDILKVMALANFWGLIAVFITNIFFKTSMHTSAAGGAIGIITILTFLSPINMTIPLLASILVAGLIGTARLVKQSHTLFELGLGYLIGFAASLAAYWWVVLL